MDTKSAKPKAIDHTNKRRNVSPEFSIRVVVYTFVIRNIQKFSIHLCLIGEKCLFSVQSYTVFAIIKKTVIF